MLGSFHTNKKAIETQILQKFINSQILSAIVFINSDLLSVIPSIEQSYASCMSTKDGNAYLEAQ